MLQLVYADRKKNLLQYENLIDFWNIAVVYTHGISASLRNHDARLSPAMILLNTATPSHFLAKTRLGMLG